MNGDVVEDEECQSEISGYGKAEYHLARSETKST
jgi:hypothetical protein